jgi:hypothetical protein
MWVSMTLGNKLKCKKILKNCLDGKRGVSTYINLNKIDILKKVFIMGEM